MSPFKEATVGQLTRLLFILDFYQDTPHGPSLIFLTRWAENHINPTNEKYSTEETLHYWENHIADDYDRRETP